MEQLRDFDFVSFEHDVLVALGGFAADTLSALSYTVAAGLAATQTTIASLSVNLAAGRIYQLAASDAVSVGSIPQNTSLIVQQGYAAGQTITLVAPSAGQSQWNLVQAQFSQVDAVRTGDPNGGIVPFYNAADPSQPISTSINTVRKAVCVIQVITGSPATTGSETPPLPTSGWVPLYLIDLAGGQTAITTGQVIAAGPSVGTGVPSSYPYAPFLAGFLASHHSGNPGQAPKIKLASEVQGVLPYINMAPVRTLLAGNLTLYVNASTGSDTNNGLTPSVPFRTIAAAGNSVMRNYDWNGFTPTISVANGTYTTGFGISGQPMGTNAAIQVIGNIAAPQSVTISVSTGACIGANFGAPVNVQGFTLTNSSSPATSSSGAAFAAGGGSVITYSAIIFGTCTFAHLYCSTSASIATSGTLAYTITGGSQWHYVCDAGGFISVAGSAVTLTGTPAFSSAFCQSARASTVQVVGGTTFTGGATGTRWIVFQNGIINTSAGNSPATYFPGSIAGTTTTGGIYL